MIDIGKLLIFNVYEMSIGINKLDIEKSLQIMSLKGNINLVQLKKRYRYLIKKYHPDKHPEEAEWYTRMMQQFNEAYTILLEYLPTVEGQAEDNDNTITVANEKKKNTDRPGAWGSQSSMETVTWTMEDIERECQLGDEYLENAVLLGWLQRYPRDRFAISMREGLEKTVSLLNEENFQRLMENSRIASYFKTLFSVFLRATESGKMRPFPIAKNSTKFMRHFSIANSYLDKGIRHFYRYMHQGNVKKYNNVPVSFLDDSVRLYSFMLPESTDVAILRSIRARIELAKLFQTRILKENLWNPWFRY